MDAPLLSNTLPTLCSIENTDAGSTNASPAPKPNGTTPCAVTDQDGIPLLNIPSRKDGTEGDGNPLRTSLKILENPPQVRPVSLACLALPWLLQTAQLG